MLLPSLLLALAVLGLALGLHRLAGARNFQLFGEIVSQVETNSPVVALTLDDGPTPEHTGRVLAILKEKGVKATFFLVGSDMEKNPDATRAIVEAGHEIGNHTYSHSDLTLASLSTIGTEIERTDAAIRAAGFEGDVLFRPPFGRKLFTLPWYVSKHDRPTIMWTLAPETDPATRTDADALVRLAVEPARRGSIILMHVMHDNREASRQALPRIIDALRAKGLEPVPVSHLLSAQTDEF
ncbi:polysaccharide deacetylase family protein [Aureimonas psammosilenae]|uniref:polysaccharide deacetylase family protein n=1 Tax=Aureimonas psammosilenae TaxID=2495496 RepID=UPI0012611431|nr:polysaccharide deacetylase family protein [Aureimonas psammosilenae]